MPTPIGIDTGGTFTDFIWVDEAGRLRVHKEPTTPDDPARAILAGLAAAGAPPDAPIIHGSTVATNALLERRGARTALITTAGFGDVLEIGRQNRPDLYALVPQKPPPLVPRRWRYEAGERVGAAGEVVRPLDEAALAAALADMAAEGIESVAVCLLFSFLYPAHERRVGDLARAALGAGVHVSLSVDVLPEYREYERTATTVINAYVAPLMGRYLARLAAALAPRPLAIMQSNGGLIGAATAGAQAARTALSGPAGGVVGAMFVAGGPLPNPLPEGEGAIPLPQDEGVRSPSLREGSGEGPGPHLITFDMGGTSTDVALCPGRLPLTGDGEIAGLPLRLPLIDIHTVGAGGGSLAAVDAGGALLVGPRSAGADPGPAAYHADYGRWRAALDSRYPAGRATVTDANLVLGRLDPAHFLGGSMSLYEDSARQALAALAADLGAASPEAAAWGVVRVANAGMERAARRVSVERGHDPRRFTLVAFGGGGPLHACELAAALGVGRVLVPPTPGVLSALGMLAAAPTRDYSWAVMMAVTDTRYEIRDTNFAGASAQTSARGTRLEVVFSQLEARARAEMAAETAAAPLDPATLTLSHRLDARYVGQSHELTIAYTPGDGPAEVVAAFHAAHAGRYGYARPDAAVEIVTARLAAVAPAQPPPLPRRAWGGADPAAALIGHKPVWFADGFVPTALYDRARLRPGNVVAGPAVVYQYDTTTVIPPGWVGRVDEGENLVMA